MYSKWRSVYWSSYYQVNQKCPIWICLENGLKDALAIIVGLGCGRNGLVVAVDVHYIFSSIFSQWLCSLVGGLVSISLSLWHPLLSLPAFPSRIILQFQTVSNVTVIVFGLVCVHGRIVRVYGTYIMFILINLIVLRDQYIHARFESKSSDLVSLSTLSTRAISAPASSSSLPWSVICARTASSWRWSSSRPWHDIFVIRLNETE